MANCGTRTDFLFGIAKVKMTALWRVYIKHKISVHRAILKARD